VFLVSLSRSFGRRVGGKERRVFDCEVVKERQGDKETRR
jgi:hypothetical protein